MDGASCRPESEVRCVCVEALSCAQLYLQGVLVRLPGLCERRRRVRTEAVVGEVDKRHLALRRAYAKVPRPELEPQGCSPPLRP